MHEVVVICHEFHDGMYLEIIIVEHLQVITQVINHLLLEIILEMLDN